MAPKRVLPARQPAAKAPRPTYELRDNVWKLLADQDPRVFYQAAGDDLDPEPNISAIARGAGLSQTTLIKLRNGDQGLTIEIFACLANFLVKHGWDRIEAQEALIKPVRFAPSTKRRLVAV